MQFIDNSTLMLNMANGYGASITELILFDVK